MRITVPYGAVEREAECGGSLLGTLDIRDVPELPDLDQAIPDALEDPIGLERGVLEIARGAESVGIVVSDAFRATCVDRILPFLIAQLNEAGVPDEAIAFFFATGSHRAPAPKEQESILGTYVYRRFQGRLVVHDAHDYSGLAYVGTTSRGTPVELNARALACQRIIVTGSTVLHYFGGYGGGRKSIMPGLASAKTIAYNHAMNLAPGEDRLEPSVRIGALDGNPVAEDMLEAARFMRCDLLINTVINRAGRIAGIFCGELDAAHRAAARFAHELFAVSIDERADLVIASCGTAKNFVQSHKALFNAYQAVKPGGRIVFLAPCPEGLGGEQFVKWLRLGERSRIFAELRKHSEINGQTALSSIEKAPITLFVTEMNDEQVGLLHGRRAASLQEAIDVCCGDIEQSGIARPTFYLMPSASYTVPFLRGAGCAAGKQERT